MNIQLLLKWYKFYLFSHFLTTHCLQALAVDETFNRHALWRLTNSFLSNWILSVSSVSFSSSLAFTATFNTEIIYFQYIVFTELNLNLGKKFKLNIKLDWYSALQKFIFVNYFQKIYLILDTSPSLSIVFIYQTSMRYDREPNVFDYLTLVVFLYCWTMKRTLIIILSCPKSIHIWIMQKETYIYLHTSSLGFNSSRWTSEWQYTMHRENDNTNKRFIFYKSNHLI